MKTIKALLSPWRMIVPALLVSISSIAQNPKPSLDKIVETSFEVKDFEVWKPVFMKDSLSRRNSGVEMIVISSKIDHPKHMMFVGMIKEVQQAKKALKNTDFLGGSAAGNISDVKSQYYEVLRFNPDANEPRWLIMNFKIKDYIKWVNAFDAGQKLRADAGLVDVLIAKDVEQPLKIQVVLDITDLNKAKAFMTSEILKQKMKSAGVIGKPDVEYYEGR
ncbi:hypothetical protein [Chryseobacterium sp. HSC-36S06]|uniref:hypothetical protein n=1 Tax=Chryseobacterium sp. HSC-36S06 TaxID=2910970 RepID=UPI0020A0C5DD|nr:hypothetical protein [Chryseobacterium sp. HSC-36S06]MCP2038360.1 hypothetical protein [Chryseobacterium sp. HSC-36S06]